LLPNLLTTACLACGFFAIVSAINGDFSAAGLALFVAMIFDGMDGRVARWTGTESVFGKEYDSLADMVSFGVAPALVAYQWGFAAISEYGDAWGRFGWIASFIYAVCAALRACAHRVCHEHLPRLPATECAPCAELLSQLFGATAENVCVICSDTVDDTIALPDACLHAFCRTCLSRAAEMKHACPMCRHALTHIQSFRFERAQNSFKFS
jgi:CDP-diacylglycerol--serine O-phosphatidyltransferase